MNIFKSAKIGDKYIIIEETKNHKKTISNAVFLWRYDDDPNNNVVAIENYGLVHYDKEGNFVSYELCYTKPRWLVESKCVKLTVYNHKDKNFYNMLNLDEMIKTAMKEKKPELQVLRMIKAKKQELLTAKNAKPYTEEVEISLLKKMKEEYEEDAKMYASRPNLGLDDFTYQKDAEFIGTLLPAEVSKEQIEEFAKTIVVAGDKKNMGNYIKQIKAQFIGADGKLVSEVVKELIG